MLSPPFQRFLLSFGDWNDKNDKQKMSYIKSFLSFIPSGKDLSGIITSKVNNLSAIYARLNNTIDEHQNKSTPKSNEKIPDPSPPRKIPITAKELDIPAEKIPKEILNEIFEKAEKILADENGITTAASADARM